jgi:hypothetical protein
MKLNATRFDQSWDRKRGAAVRLTAVLLQEDDAALQRRVCENDKTVKTYTSAADWLGTRIRIAEKDGEIAGYGGGTPFIRSGPLSV